ncbi:MAG TPA: ABC transporter permease subunit [Pseudolabrys sp.]|nr:ABC transporter permease subunit [Pseudolabrys sp.]
MNFIPFYQRWRGTILLILALVIGWQLLYAAIGEVAMRSPLETLHDSFVLLAKPSFWPHVQETLAAFAMALVIAVVSGLVIGLALGFNRLANEVMEPMLVAFYALPKVTLYPIILLSFGLGISAKVAFGAIHGVVPIALFTINAVRNIKPILIKTGRVMNFSAWDMSRRVLIPAALPEIFSGIRVGFALTLIGTLLGEMFASQRGLGYMLMTAIGLHNVETIMAVTFMLIVFAAAISSILLAIDRRLHKRA